MFDSKLHSSMKNSRASERYRDILRMEVLPVMDARAESDFLRSAGTVDDSLDVEVLRECIRLGHIKANGIFSVGDERVGTFFYSVLTEISGDKSLMIVGIGAGDKSDETPVYERLIDAVFLLAKKENCRWLKAGSTRSGVIRLLLARGMTPVRVDFCMEVK